ncbi:MAG TPA: hypothetical protein VGM39_11025 [Kofleriaceae bacterium]
MRWWVICMLAGCGRVGFDTVESRTDGGTPDAPFGAWSPPTTLPRADSATEDEEDIAMSSSKLEAYFGVGPDDGSSPKVLRMMTRQRLIDPWSADVPIAVANQSQWSTGPRLSPDDNTLYFNTTAAGGPGGQNIFRVTRNVETGAWENPEPVPGVNDDDDEQWFAPCNGGAYVMARSDASSHFSLYEGVLGSGTAPVLSSLEDADVNESGPFVTADCLTLYFSSDATGGGDLFMTHRASLASAWETPTPLDVFNTNDTEGDPWLSADGHLFAFSSNRNGTDDVFLSTR